MPDDSPIITVPFNCSSAASWSGDLYTVCWTDGALWRTEESESSLVENLSKIGSILEFKGPTGPPNQSPSNT